MFSLPGETSATVQQGVEVYVELRALAGEPIMAILACPMGLTPTQAVTHVDTTVNLSHDQIAIYYPWITVTDPETGLPVTIPPDGHVQGAYARVETKANIAKAPAGVRNGRLLGTRGVERKLDRTDRDTVYPSRINPIAIRPGGVTIYGSRTLGAAGELRQINKRRVQNFAILSIGSETEFIVFENNDANGRAQWRRSVGAFLLRMWKNGLLDGQSASEAYYLQADENNNTEAIRREHKFIGLIGLKHKNTIEFALYTFEEDLRGLQEELAAEGLT